MSWLLQISIGVSMIILCGGVVNWVDMFFESRYTRNTKDHGKEDQLGMRLNATDHRLTDVQDVLIALSEKLDRIEKRERI
jgi:hypothetical protein